MSNKNNFNKSIILHLSAYFVFLLMSCQCLADDVFSSYVANLYLLESHQAHTPDSPFLYTDSENGLLLRSVLDPNQAKPALKIYFEAQKNKKKEQNLPQLLGSIANRYEHAFSENPHLYESEYLDSLEISAFIINNNSATTIAAEDPKTDVNAMPLPADNKQALSDDVQKLMKSMSSLMTSVKHAYADSVRKKVASNTFTQNGALRALQIADSISLPMCTQSIVDGWQKQILVFVAANTKYPKLAQMRGFQGKGAVLLILKSNAEDVEISHEIKISTGYEMLDNEMLQILKRADLPTLECYFQRAQSIQLELPFSFELPRKAIIPATSQSFL